jgi:hypothetical protein
VTRTTHITAAALALLILKGAGAAVRRPGALIRVAPIDPLEHDHILSSDVLDVCRARPLMNLPNAIPIGAEATSHPTTTSSQMFENAYPSVT